MSEFNEHINPLPQGQGDPNWQRLFDEASEIPPPRVWDAIEQDLDREEDDRVIVVPFWGRSASRAWSTAAAVVLLLLGWWSLSFDKPFTNPAIQPSSMASKQLSPESNNDVARRQTNESAALLRKPSEAPPIINPDDKDRLVKPKSGELSQLPARTSERLAANGSAVRQFGSTNREQPPLARSELITQPKMAPGLQSELPISLSNQPIGGKTAQNAKPFSSESIAGVAPRQLDSDAPKPAAGQTSPDKQIPEIVSAEVALARLTTRPVRLPAMYGTQRIVWFHPTEQINAPAETTSRKASSEHWASVSVMPSSFNPSVGLQQAAAVYGNAFTQSSPIANPNLKSQADLSMAYQLSGGVQLSNRWSVETGVGYLEARSTVNSPVQTIISSLAPNGRLSNLYADALNNSRVSDKQNNFLSSPSMGTSGKSGSPSAADPLFNTNVYDVGRSQVLSNDYTFVQVPVQLGYQIRPRKRLGFTVLGGLLTNLFVRNTVNDQLSITNSDMVYRPVTLSASTGLRFRYRPTRRWSASMAGIFQQALQKGTRTGTDLTTRPQTMGVSVGLDYHF